MCPFIEKKKKEKRCVSFNIVLKTRLRYFFNHVQPLPPIINDYYNVQPPSPRPALLFQPLLLFGTREYVHILKNSPKRLQIYIKTTM